MSDALFEKILIDLGRIPQSHACAITLHRINEPLLDDRIERFSGLVRQALPAARQQFWSNGTMLREGQFEWMAGFDNASLTVSLNSMDEAEHTAMMGFGLGAVLRGLDYVHGLVVAGRFPLFVTLSGPFKSQDAATRFQQSCKQRWPRFHAASRPYFQWMGGSLAGQAQRISFGLPSRVGDAAADFACAQWFDLHVLANGFVTRCSVDETGPGGDPGLDTSMNDVLEIYRRRAALRRDLPARRTVPGCQGCLHLG
jgi:hypothetical protein